MSSLAIVLSIISTVAVAVSTAIILSSAALKIYKDGPKKGFNGTLLYQDSKKWKVYWSFIVAYMMLCLGFLLMYGTRLWFHSYPASEKGYELMCASLGAISIFFFVLIMGFPGQHTEHYIFVIFANILMTSYLFVRQWFLGILPVVLFLALVGGYIYGRISKNWILFSVLQFGLGIAIIAENFIYHWLLQLL